ncbi:MAG: DUF1513 domain-containing protein [Bermanella sp.]
MMSTFLNPTSLTRRQVLKGLGAIASAPLISACGFTNPQGSADLWISAAGNGKNNNPYALAWGTSTESRFSDHSTGQQASAFRGHGLTKSPAQPNQAIMFSRRLGNQALVMNMHNKKIEHTFTSPDHLFMEGHGCFNHDGSLLFCSETNKHTRQGIITVRETQSFKVIKEYGSGGTGPHEILMRPNENTLVVANGGLIKDKEGNLINGATMAPNISLLNTENGKVKSSFQSHHDKASLRHMDISIDGTIAIAAQVQRKYVGHQANISLTSLIKPNGQVIQLQAPEQLLKKLNDYVGSVRINNQYKTVAFTSPRGDLALFWNIDTGKFLGHHFFHNVCGLTVSSDEEYFVLSNSAGKIRQVHGSSLIEYRDLRQTFPQIQWDNHMLTVSDS